MLPPTEQLPTALACDALSCMMQAAYLQRGSAASDASMRSVRSSQPARAPRSPRVQQACPALLVPQLANSSTGPLALHAHALDGCELAVKQVESACVVPMPLLGRLQAACRT